MLTITTATEFGQTIRANRKAIGMTLQGLAVRIGCRRQTLADLETGKNVCMHTAFAALNMLGKGVLIVDKRPELDRLQEIFNDPAD